MSCPSTSYTARLALLPFSVGRNCDRVQPRYLRKRCMTCRAEGGNRDEMADLDQQLLDDLQRLRQRQQPGSPASSAAPRSAASVESQSGGGFKDVIDKVLIADFFFILFSLAWFAAGLVQRSSSDSTALLDSWYSLWQWVFQPALGVLMLGAISSGLFEWVKDNLQRK